MDRAAKLAAEARHCLWEEIYEGRSRSATRAHLANYAAHLGFAPNEISAAIDEALTAAGATP